MAARCRYNSRLLFLGCPPAGKFHFLLAFKKKAQRGCLFGCIVACHDDDFTVSGLETLKNNEKKHTLLNPTDTMTGPIFNI